MIWVKCIKGKTNTLFSGFYYGPCYNLCYDEYLNSINRYKPTTEQPLYNLGCNETTFFNHIDGIHIPTKIKNINSKHYELVKVIE